MSLIATKSFNLAVKAQGDENAGTLALVLPGFLDTKDYPHMRSHVELLASQGYYALSFDPPGTWGSDGEIGEYSMTNYLKAVDELIEQLGGRPTLLVGHSLGGRIAALAAITNPNVTAFAAIMAPVMLFHGDDFEARRKQWQTEGVRHSSRDLPDAPDQTTEFNVPYSFSEDSRRYDSVEELRTLTKPKLFVVGSYDAAVPPQEARLAYDAAADPKQLHEVESDHDYRNHPEIIDQVNQLLKNFTKDYTEVSNQRGVI